MATIRRDHALRLLRVAARFVDGTSWGRAVEGELEFGVASDEDRENSSGATTHHYFLTLERAWYR